MFPLDPVLAVLLFCSSGRYEYLEDIASEYNATKSRVVHIVAKAEKKGLISIYEGLADRCVKITDTGVLKVVEYLNKLEKQKSK